MEKTENLSIDLSSAGDARIYARDELTARSSSAGSIFYKGEVEVEVVDAKSSSAGSAVRK